MTHSTSTVGRRQSLRGSAAGMATLSAVGSPLATSRARAAAVPVRFGGGSAIAYNPICIAKDKGFYEEEGLSVELIRAQAAPVRPLALVAP